MKPKNLNNFKRLYFKTDKERITQIMHHLNIKYLLSLYKKGIHAQRLYLSWEHTYPTEEDWKNAYTTIFKMVNYDGCRFRVSVKTFKDELKRREELGEVISINHTTPNGHVFRIQWKINKNFKQNK